MTKRHQGMDAPHGSMLKPGQRRRRKAKPPESCVGCGCTDDRACPGGCCWTVPGVCSACYGIVVMVLPAILHHAALGDLSKGQPKRRRQK